MTRSKTIRILLLAVAIVIATDVTTRLAASEEQVTLTDRLAVQPVDGGVYLLGNSMFKTGVDLEAMQQGIPERDVRFNYYDGHYTSLWYLIAEGALGPSSERPELVVWGFRPGYAMLPAFRQNRPNSTELFEFDDLVYDRLTGDSVATPLIDAQSFLQDWSGMYAERPGVQETVSRVTERAGLEALDAVGQNVGGLWDRLIDGDGSIADEIVRAATGGAVQLTEEQVVDGVGDFVTGPTVGFADGFIPLTAQSFAEHDLAQLVVIWRPVNAAQGTPDPNDEQFVSDAVEYFEARNIPYVDFFHNDQLDVEMFAKGDHYNAAGRAYVTELLTEAIGRLLPPTEGQVNP